MEESTEIIATLEGFQNHGSLTSVITNQGSWFAETRGLFDSLENAFGEVEDAIGQEVILYVTSYGTILGFDFPED